jgi:hypothetical protein
MRGRFFLALLPDVERRRDGACGRGHAEAQDCSRGKLSLFSDFLQKFAVRALPGAPQLLV